MPLEGCFCPCARPQEEAGLGNCGTGVKGEESWAKGRGEVRSDKERAGLEAPVSTREGSRPAASSMLGYLESLSRPCPLPKAIMYGRRGLTAGNPNFPISSKQKMHGSGTTARTLMSLLGCSCLVRPMTALFGGSWYVAEATDNSGRPHLTGEAVTLPSSKPDQVTARRIVIVTVYAAPCPDAQLNVLHTFAYLTLPGYLVDWLHYYFTPPSRS